jgi:hypothetical protein
VNRGTVSIGPAFAVVLTLLVVVAVAAEAGVAGVFNESSGLSSYGL